MPSSAWRRRTGAPSALRRGRDGASCSSDTCRTRLVAMSAADRRAWGRGAGEEEARVYVFLFNDTATTEIYTLSLHDALPISYGRDVSSLDQALHPFPWQAAP